MNAVDALAKLLDLFIAGSLAYERVVEMKAKLDVMKAEGRDPTEAEWAALFNQIDADSAALDQADKRLNP